MAAWNQKITSGNVSKRHKPPEKEVCVDNAEKLPQHINVGKNYRCHVWYAITCVVFGAIFLCIFSFTNIKGKYIRDLKWWQTAVIYQVYPRSFRDTDGDGIGDLKGIASKLDYFRYLNVDAIWLNPVYESPMVDFGYDVSNFTRIDPIFGTMADFDKLTSLAHSADMKIIMDFIPNHSSDKHPWFEQSRTSRVDSNKYRDWYVWHDGKVGGHGERLPPNNWLSFFGGPAWTFDENRKQYYLHQYTSQQPDLNWYNKGVVEAMTTALRFWLDRGVDGFRVDSVFTLFETNGFPDEPRSFVPNVKPNEHKYLKHVHTQYNRKVEDVIKMWRDVLDEYESRDRQARFLVTEAYSEDIQNIIDYYNAGADMSFNFDMIGIKKTCDGYCMRALIDNLLLHLPEGKWPNFVVANHDNKRITSRYDRRFVDAINMLLLLLPGTPTVYYGDELGLEEINVDYEHTQDPYGRFYGPNRYQEVSRDPCRSPMLWDDSHQAGFSTADKTWLPVHPSYRQNNVKVQKEEPNSHLNKFVKLTTLRKLETFVMGDMAYSVVNHNTLSFTRKHHGSAYIVIMNVGESTFTDNFAASLGTKYGELVFFTGDKPNLLHVGQRMDLEQVTLNPGQGLVVKSS